jgi:hypothetical protein
MRYRMLVALVCLAGCKGKEEPSVAVAATPPRASIGLYGDWVHIAPEALRGDTLRLRADSTADGLVPWDNERAARIWRWRLIFGSKDPVNARFDWRQGHNDGRDVECISPRYWPDQDSGGTNARSSKYSAIGCRSMPMICFGAGPRWQCETFHFVAPDSLWLMDGSRFVRAKPTPAMPPSPDPAS